MSVCQPWERQAQVPGPGPGTRLAGHQGATQVGVVAGNGLNPAQWGSAPGTRWEPGSLAGCDGTAEELVLPALTIVMNVPPRIAQLVIWDKQDGLDLENWLREEKQRKRTEGTLGIPDIRSGAYINDDYHITVPRTPADDGT